jgi:tRNA (guanine26-N2/guanine27-N2)-dimethyltransferase
VKQHPIKRLAAHSPAAVCLAREPSIQANFEVRQDANPISRQSRMLRFQENPDVNWGPKSRAKKRKCVDSSCETIPEKRKRLQGHRTGVLTKTNFKQYKCKRFMKVLLDMKLP